MSHQSELIEKDILAYLKEHENKELLRFLTCGSVDDGKSTLIGRLLHDSKMIYEDQLAAITQDSKKSGTTGDEVDLALLVDGLQSEREQGITIDVAYRYFSTSKRKFIIADTPGHEQYTRNMATGASTCDLAIILIDARSGVKTQTKRHSFIVSLLGIKHVVVAVNKMDLVDYSEDVYNKIKEDYLNFAQELNIPDIRFVPMSALKGDNVVTRSESAPWFKGETLMELLEGVQIVADRNFSDFRMPVQYVNRPNLNYRGFAGTIASGVVRKGDAITAMPSGKTSKVKSIDTFDGEIDEAFAPMAVTLTLEDEIDISRGDVIVASDNLPSVTQAVQAHVVWMAEDAMQPGKLYDFKLGTKTTSGQVSEIDFRINVNTLAHEEAKELALNEIGVCDVQFNAPLVAERYDDNPGLGSFIVIDRMTNVTVGAGMVMKSIETSASEKQFSEFEIELNQLVRKHFPHWQAIDLAQLMKK
ncbi:sulfate adenylyltransferase subunit CysN [Catenovulum sp. 2E275]|uniref:sulfate adenylyltransferase subunit CysN n=1 Tax=Catenovulum sp. 2E275 TaxID=2980497 RepID=UPI0021CEF262|nr:sulfate adenylyltransferase subunit CysN [Catenovulum sp. 2E275]MCU4675579.1 sulfate adenylyltransferase subunit CysN [Catenovulum sp. 2E275]